MEVSDQQQFGKGFTLACIAVIFWSGNFIAARALRGAISPVSLAFFRWLIATLVLFPIARKAVKAEWSTLRSYAGYLSLTALAGITVFNTLLYVAGKNTSATNMALIGTTASPVFVFLLSAVFLRQRFSPGQYLGIALCILGILSLLSGGDPARLLRFHFSEGDLWVLGAALTFAIYTMLVRRKPTELSSICFLFALFLSGTLFLLPVFAVNSLVVQPVAWGGALVGALLYLGVCASVIAFSAWNLAIKHLGAPRTALFGNLIPVFSSIEAAWLLHEPLTAVTVASFALILAGLIVANLQLIKSMHRRR